MIVPNESRVGTKTKFVIFGKSFDTMSEAEEYRDSTIERREAIAGRRLSETELVRGPDVIRQPGWSTPGARIEADKWQPIQTPIEPKPVTFEPLDKPYNYGTALHPGKRAAIAEQQYLERKAREAGLDTVPDKTRESARDYALSVYEKVVFNPNSTDSQVAKAKQLVEQASHCLETFTAMANELATDTAIQHATLAQNLNDQIGQTCARLNALEPLPAFVAPTEKENEPNV